MASSAHTRPLSEVEIRVKALESLLVEKGLIDPAAVDEAIATRAFRAVVEASTREAHRLGINAVPAFVIDERELVLGAQPHAVFEQLLGGRERPEA